jgi:lipopolysaccharide export system permease protein
MRILDIYIGKSFLYYVTLICLMLLVLFSLFELISQLGDVGKGSYQLKDAFLYVALTLPKRLLDLMPISTLIGGILALGMMADRGELVAMEASGITIIRICTTVLVTGMLLMILSAIMAEMVVPGMERKARDIRARVISDTSITLTREGFWARMGDSYIHVDKVLRHGEAANINIFAFDTTGRLQTFTHAQKAHLKSNRQWILSEVTQKNIADNSVITRQTKTLNLDSFLNADQVRVLELPPYSISTPDLIHYIEALQQSGQNADQYSIALWRKLTLPLTTGAMVLLSLSFVFGSTRNISASKRITSGVLVGILLHLSDQILMQWGLMLNLYPWFTAMMPVLLVSSIAFVKLRRTFW